MKKKWSKLKELIGAYEQQEGIFLSLINEDGKIICANANMVKTLHLQNPRRVDTKFQDLLHPVNLNDFKTAIRTSTEKKSPCSLELYLKNGYYHPMKWDINCLKTGSKGDNKFLCIGHKILDEKRIEQFNQLGEKNYQLIVEGLNAGVLFQDSKGELIAANQKAAEMFSTTLERLYQLTDIGSLWNSAWDIRTEEGKPADFESTPFMTAVHTGQLQTEVLVFRLKNGECKSLQFSSQPLFEENNPVPFAVVSNIVDLTHEKKLSGQLKEREALFNVFMKQTPNLAWVVDEDANLVFASESFYQYFGLDINKSVNKNIADLIPSVVAGALYEKHHQVLQTGMPVELVEKVKWANGTNFVFHINIFPIEGVTSKKMLGGHAVNLSDKFAAEKKLKEVNEKTSLAQ
ncbi:MAG: PAS domain S-box protein [Chitinophagaceae bacterium]